MTIRGRGKEADITLCCSKKAYQKQYDSEQAFVLHCLTLFNNVGNLPLIGLNLFHTGRIRSRLAKRFKSQQNGCAKHPPAPSNSELEMNTDIHVGVRFDTALHNELVAAARSYDLSVSRLVREATAYYLKLLGGESEAQLRRQISSEYTALAIDLIISTEYPAERDRLIDEAVRRAEAVNANALKALKP
jgi:hypothetical protein